MASGRFSPHKGWIAALCAGLLLAAMSMATAAVQPVAKPTPDVLAARALLDAYSGRGDGLPVALDHLTRALQANPRDHLALKEMSRYHVISGFIVSNKYAPGSLESAEATIREALAVAPQFAEGHIFLGHIQLQQRRLDDALASLQHAESLGTDDPSLDLNLARVYSALGKHREVQDRAQRVLDSNTATRNQKSAASSLLVDADTRAGESGAAVSRYEEQVRANPTNAWVRGEFAQYLSETLGRHDDAITEARKALEIMDYGVGRRILAMALYRKWAEWIAAGKGIEGEAFLLEASELHPQLDAVMAYGAATEAGEQLTHALITHKNISIDARAEDGSTALLIATNTGRVAVVKRLLDLGADVSIASDNGWTPLRSAADDGNAEIVELLLARTEHTPATRPAMVAATFAERKGHVALAARMRAWDEAAQAAQE
jgi:tetratricopeptide (TPR) repeat protein